MVESMLRRCCNRHRSEPRQAMRNQELLRTVCAESGMDYSKLSEQDKQAVSDYITACPETSLPTEQAAYLRQKAYLAVMQDRLRRFGTWKKEQLVK